MYKLIVDNISERTAFLNIYVSETPDVDTPQTLCHAVLAEGRRLNTFANCMRPMFGRYVKLKRDTGPHVHESNWMNFCEAQVYGYIYHGKSPLPTWYTTRTTRVAKDVRSYALGICTSV